VAAYRRWLGPTAATRPRPRAWCRVSARYNPGYGDYDVYVHSDQPDRKVTVTDSHGDRRTWYTDASGYGDVYLRVHGSAGGQRLTVRVGGASCSATL